MNTDNPLFVPEGLHTSSEFENNNKNKSDIYIGRFAPSPTGPLHFGSLIAATASYLNAIVHKNHQWLLRIEDIDTARIQKGATRSIINSLEAYGFEWQGEILYQSQRNDIYREVLSSISEFTFPCSCTRKSLMSATGSYSYIYPGFCRDGVINKEAPNNSIRVITNSKQVCFQDKCQPNEFCQNINKEVGDFILKRSDGLWAYQLAVVVDDALQGITEVVRGADLYDNTPRQIYLQQLLGYTQPDYFHFPVAVDEKGKKLSKQNLSAEISSDHKQDTLIDALQFLGQTPPNAKEFVSVDDLWLWAVQNWNPSQIPKVLTKRYE